MALSLHNGKAILVSFTDKVDYEFLSKYPDLKVVGSNTTGIEHIDFEECEKRGIKVFTLRGEREFLDEISSTAEHTMGLIVALARKYKQAFQQPFQESIFYTGIKLKGKVLGLIGYGRIARQVERIASSMGMKVIWYDAADVGERIWNIGDVIGLSDIISIHIPLEENEGFINEGVFKEMKPNTLFINTSRDGVIAKGALQKALEKRLIAGAAIDFADDPDLVQYSQSHDNLLITNHIGGKTFEDQELTKNFILKKIEEYLCQKVSG